MNTGWPEPQEFWSKRRVCVTGGAAYCVVPCSIARRMLVLDIIGKRE